MMEAIVSASKCTRREKQRRAIERMVAHQLFHRMITCQGIDLVGGWRRGLEEMIFHALRKCELCASTQVCRDWLRSDCRRASYVAFCPNAELIETCRILDPNALSLNSDLPEAYIRCKPSLAEILAEPIIKLVMASDHVGAAQLPEASTDLLEAPHG
ncbi:MAG: DUF6455 family protein [Stellaceae bacterium]